MSITLFPRGSEYGHDRSNHCCRCAGLLVPERQWDYETGYSVDVQYCLNCGCRQQWGVVRTMA